MPPVQGGDNTNMPSSASLVPMALVAIGVLVLALVVAGKTKPGTIVVQRITMTSTTTNGGKTRHLAFSIVAITESSASGSEQRSFTSTSFTRQGFQQVGAGNAIQLYDPIDDTIYVTTEQAQQRAIVEQTKASAPKGAMVTVGVGKMQVVSASSVGYEPERDSGYEQLVRNGYKPAGRETIDGQAALRFIQGPATSLALTSGSRSFESSTTVYVSPASYAPIETVNRTKLPGSLATSTTRWHTYRVLPATPANKRLLSLTARHPQARVVDNAMGFLRASQSAIPTTTVRTG